MILTFSWRTLAVALLAVPLACTRPADQPPDSAGIAELIGVLKLVRQEYANAVTPDGTQVVNEVEYAESELFAEQAEVKLQALRSAGTLQEDQAKEIGADVARMRAGVVEKAPQKTVTTAATAAIGVLQKLLAGTVPETIRGAVLASTRADESLAAEEIVGQYRVGILGGAARTILAPAAAEAAPVPDGSTYVGVTLRERRTKRFLPAADVRVAVAAGDARTEAQLTELWGDFHQYGANVALPPDGPAKVTVTASPPAYARHGDMLGVFVEPVTASFDAIIRDRMLTFDAKPVAPVDDDYAVGDDLLLALAETGGLHDAGPYRVGVIVEAPEPVWTWTAGSPKLEPVGEHATNHVEVVLVDRETGQLVPSASVKMTFLAGEREIGSADLHPLLSVFAHYGRTLALPAGTTTVRVHIQPPPVGSLDHPRLTAAAEIELPLPAPRGGAT
jgi:hypothetical protein